MTITIGKKTDMTKMGEKLSDKVAEYVHLCHREAKAYRDSLPYEHHTLGKELQEAYDQYHGVWAKDYVALGGKPIYTNFASNKVDVIKGFLDKVAFDESVVPFTLSPTPVPELDSKIEKLAKSRAIQRMAELPEVLKFGSVEPESLPMRLKSEDEAVAAHAAVETELAREIITQYIDAMRYQVRGELERAAEEPAKRMQELIADQLVEGKFSEQIDKFKEDVLIYPFAVVIGPVTINNETITWQGSSLKATEKLAPRFYSGDPLKTFWSPDSTSTQDGTYMLLEQEYSREQIQMMSHMDQHYAVDAARDILEVLAEVETNKYSAKLYDLVRTKSSVITLDAYRVKPNQPIKGLTYYGRISGARLKDMGYSVTSTHTPINDYETYETEITVVAGRTVRAILYDNPYVLRRPVHIVSIKGKTYGMYGKSFIQAFRTLEIAYNDKALWEHNNDYMTSADLVEIDASRLHPSERKRMEKLMEEGKRYSPIPGTFFAATGGTEYNATGRMLTVHKLAEPNATRSMSLARIQKDIDRFSGVPSTFHGEPVSSGMMRSFKTASLLHGSAADNMAQMAKEIDKGLYFEVALSLYRHNLAFSDDAKVKGDCEIEAKGAQGAVAKEIALQNAREQLMTVVQSMGMAQGISSPTARAEIEATAAVAFRKLTKTMDIDEEEVMHEVAEIMRVAEEQQQQQMAIMQQQAAEAQNQSE